MKTSSLLYFLEYSQQGLTVIILVIMACRRVLSKFPILTFFLFLTFIYNFSYTVLRELHVRHVLTQQAAYNIYFATYWVSFFIAACAKVGIVFQLYKMALAPLPGLQNLGKLVFRWAVAIAICVALGVALGSHTGGSSLMLRSAAQLEQTESILTLCLLLFVTFASQPLGFSLRSRIFGISFGLGLLATSELVEAAGITHQRSLLGLGAHLSEVTYIVAGAIWAVYFLLPEPKRQMIVLPTTSPFLRWNQIAHALGDAPGYVAVGGFDPSFLAPAEVEIMERASLKMRALESRPVLAFEPDRREVVGAR